MTSYKEYRKRVRVFTCYKCKGISAGKSCVFCKPPLTGNEMKPELAEKLISMLTMLRKSDRLQILNAYIEEFGDVPPSMKRQIDAALEGV